MRTQWPLLFLLIIALPFGALCAQGQTKTSKSSHILFTAYLQKKQDYITYLNDRKNEATADDEAEALKELESDLKIIFKPYLKTDIIEQSTLGVPTLFDAFVDNRIDGLVQRDDKTTYFYTLPQIVSAYYGNSDKTIHITNDVSLASLLNSAFAIDADLIEFAQYKLEESEHETVYGLIGGFTQDMTPLFPQFMFLCVVTKNRITMIEKGIDFSAVLPPCKTEYEAYSKGTFSSFESAHQISQDYLKCFRSNFKNSEEEQLVLKSFASFIEESAHRF